MTTSLYYISSDQAVWTLSRTGEIYKRHGVSNTNFVGDYWKKVLGNVKTITGIVFTLVVLTYD